MKKLFITLFVILLSINTTTAQNTKKVLLEEFSTAQCGFCPEGAIIAEQLMQEYPDLYSYTHHAGFGTDSMTIDESRTIAKYTTFAPAAVIDRGDYKCPPFTKEGFLGISRQKWDSIAAIRLNDEALAKVDVQADFDMDNNMAFSVTVEFLKEVEDNDYRINLVIVEDSLVGEGRGWDQVNYFNNNQKYPSLYQKGDPIVGYFHRHVIRAMPTGAWGTSGIIPSTPEVGRQYIYNLEGFEYPEIWKIKDLKVYGFVSVYNEDIYQHKVLNTDETGFISSTSVNVSNDNIGFKILPNPVDGLGYIECNFDMPQNAKFDLYSINGRLLRTIKESYCPESINVYFHTSDLPQGLYFIKITGKDKVIIRDFIVF